MVNSPLIRPYLLGGGSFGGGTLESHDIKGNQWSMVGNLVPLKGGIGSIVHPPIGRKNTTYIPLIVLAF